MSRRRETMFRATRGLTHPDEEVQRAFAAVRAAHTLREEARRLRLKKKTLKKQADDTEAARRYVHELAAEAGGPEAYLQQLAEAVRKGTISADRADVIAWLLETTVPSAEDGDPSDVNEA